MTTRESKINTSDSHRRVAAPFIIARKSERPDGANSLRQRLGNYGAVQLMSEASRSSFQTRAPVVQAKLTISQPGDAHEREADRVADAVMRMPEQSSVKISSMSSSSSSSVQRRCVECDEDQKKKSEVTIQRSATSAARIPAPPIVHEALSSPGQPLGIAQRAFMEPRFGRDFSDVRVHTGAKAAESAAAVQARAYTVGNNIVFGGNGSASDHSLLAHELAHVVQQGGGASNGAIVQRRLVTEGVGGCGLCDEARFVGTDLHTLIQRGAFPASVRREFPVGFTQLSAANGDMDGRLDLLELTVDKDRRSIFVSIGEIKPNNYNGIKAGVRDLAYYDEAVRLYFKRAFPDHAVFVRRLDINPSPPFLIYTETPGCPSQLVEIENAKDGLYLYNCAPTRAQLAAQRRDCCKGVEKEDDKKPKDKEPKDKEPGPSESFPEQLLKLGKELAPWLVRAGMFDIGFALARVMLSFLAGPFAALAAVILGIAMFWDQLKWLAGKIAGIAQAVWDKIAGLAGLVRDGFSFILGKLHDLGIKLAELGRFVAGKIVAFAKKIAAGVAWVAGRIAAGAKWVGGKIVSGAEAFWDWLWGSDVEPIYPVIDIPIPRETHCRTVAMEDTIIRLPADLLFPFKEWELGPGAIPLLEDAKKKISSMLHKDDWISFEGYTDVIGTHDKNQRLSKQRAETVRSWFVAQGVIPKERTRIEGYGKTQAKARANDEEGRKKDRRVDIYLPKRGGTRTSCW